MSSKLLNLPNGDQHQASFVVWIWRCLKFWSPSSKVFLRSQSIIIHVGCPNVPRLQEQGQGRIVHPMRQIQRLSEEDVPQEHHVLTHHAAPHVEVRGATLSHRWPFAGQIKVTLRRHHKLQRVLIEAPGPKQGAISGQDKVRAAVGVHFASSWCDATAKKAFPQRCHQVWIPSHGYLAWATSKWGGAIGVS